MESNHPPPRRQNSTVSSASSTVRAGSSSGRRRRSSGSNHTTSNGLFARLTGKNNSRAQDGDSSDDDSTSEDGIVDDSHNSSPTPPPGWRSRSTAVTNGDDPEAGPSDYYQRSPSPASISGSDIPHPPHKWREMSSKTDFDPEEGPSDYWQRSSPSLLPRLDALPRGLHDDVPPSPEVNDEAEYGRRMKAVFAQSSPPRPNGIRPVSNEESADSAGYFGYTTYTTPGTSDAGTPNTRRYNDEYRAIVGEKDGIGEEEFGVLEFPVRDDASDKTPSASSVSASGSGDGRRLLLSQTRPRTPGLYPTNKAISRLRSHLRTTSSATQNTLASPVPPGHHRAPSHFSQISRSESFSTTSGFEKPKPPDSAIQTSSPAFAFHPLRHLSAHLFSRQSGTLSPKPQNNRKANSIDSAEVTLGRPMVVDVRGMIAVGTEGGWVVVYTFGQEIKTILGNDTIAASSGPVTAVTISPDQTYIAVGHASGNIYLYDLSSPPTKPARTTLALSLSQVLSGRKEGHLQNSRILHIGFVGIRHTSIVSGDEHGRAFWWSLGKVIGVESNDVVRMLGSYPDDKKPKPASKRPTTLFAVLPLPLGEGSHPTDTVHLTALLTPVKLVIVGMKPSAKTWFRKMRESAGGPQGGLMGCASWLRSGEVPGPDTSDPVLAYSWGRAVRFLRIKVVSDVEKEVNKTPEFVEGRRWEASNPIRALQWYDENHLLLVTTVEAILLDVRSMTAVEDTPLQTKLLTGHDFFSSLRGGIEAINGSIRSYRGKLFLLTKTNLQVGTLLHWNDRVLSRVHQGDFLGAIQLALAYYEDRASGNLINLPEDATSRKTVIGLRVKELMHASLDWAFSEDRMRDDTHFSADGRGVDLTELFEGLATTCIEACLSMDDHALLFDDVYEHFSAVGIQAMFLSRLEGYLFDGRLREYPPNIIQALIAMHDDRGEYDLAEALIWHVNPAVLDINQAVTLCEAHGLWDALIHVYTRALKDYVAPIVKLLGLVREVQRRRRDRPSLVGENDVAENAPDAYKLYAYIENILSGLSYPSAETLPEPEANSARSDTYEFIFQGQPVAWPFGGDLVLTDEDVSYPYLHILLRFDTEAFLHAMDIAFEDPYLNDTGAAINRQSIVNLMLDVMDDSFPSSDVTFLHIFVARNLPKYPQFLFIPPSTLHRILVSLASDQDQSTREDRQLAAEFLLSAYTPHDADAMMALFEKAGFFRVLRSTYQREKKWAQLVSAYIKDPETDAGVFTNIDEILQTSTAPQVSHTVSEALPHLFELSVRQTALLLDKHLPALHPRAIQALSSAPHKQMAYLKCLLETSADEDEKGPLQIRKMPSVNLDTNAKHLYVALLCRQDPTAVVTFLDERGPDFFDLPRLAEQCEEERLFEGQLWALDRQGKTKETFETVQDVLRGNGADLGQAIISGDEGGIHMTLQTLESVSKMAVRLCQEHSSAPDIEDMWFGLLDEIVQLVNSVVILGSSDTTALDSLRSLTQSTLSSLVSSASPLLSFPRLFKRLVERTTTTKSVKKGRAYSEFRTILMGMLDSYKAEGEMLSLTIRLVEADLFGDVEELTVKRMRGWRPSSGICNICNKGVVGDKSGPLVVLGSGEVRHQTCHE